MDLNLLHVFEAVYREQHLTRAAEVLALSPSAVSHALRRLREQLGDALFVRDGRLMRPTPTCQRLAPALLDQLARLRQLIQTWGQFDPTSTRQRFRIGMPDPVELMLLTPLHRRLITQAPLSTIASTHFDRSSLARTLAAGQLDLAIDVALPLGAPVRHALLLEDRFCLLMRRSPPAAEAPPSLAQYLGAKHVAVSSRATGMVMEDGAMAHLGWQREVAVRCQNYTTAVRLVADSELWLTVPERLADEIGPGPAVTRWPLPFPLPPVQLHLYWHGHRDGDPANDWLRQQVMTLAA